MTSFIESFHIEMHFKVFLFWLEFHWSLVTQTSSVENWFRLWIDGLVVTGNKPEQVQNVTS